MVYKDSERGDFDKFNIKSHFPLCVTGFYLDQGDFRSVIEPIVRRHKAEGLTYVEYRQAVGYSEAVKEEWKKWHLSFIRYLKEVSDEHFKGRYIFRITEDSYPAIREIIDENPDLIDVMVGIDFTGREEPPKNHGGFFKRLHEDNKNNPHSALEFVMHIGEDYFDKSIESAIRWCHESAYYGAKRLGHCIALGLDPQIALDRRQNAHTREKVSERLDQIEYDLKYMDLLKDRGVKIDAKLLIEEKKHLSTLDPDDFVKRDYDLDRIQNLRLRQDFVLDYFKNKGTTIEVCPTSNLRIGGLTTFEDHPLHKFNNRGVDFVICSDDPGIFNITLASEIDLVSEKMNIKNISLENKLKDPYQYRLGQSRK